VLQTLYQMLHEQVL